MPIWLQIVIGVFGLIGTIFGIFGISTYISERMKHAAVKKNEEDDQNELLKRQRDFEKLKPYILNDLKDAIRETMKEETKEIKMEIDAMKRQLELNNIGTVTLLRSDMKMQLDFGEKEGFMSSSGKSNWRELYNTYEELGGNHFKEYVNGWKEQMEHLPTEKKSKKKSGTILTE